MTTEKNHSVLAKSMLVGFGALLAFVAVAAMPTTVSADGFDGYYSDWGDTSGGYYSDWGDTSSGMTFNDCYYYGDCYEPSFDYGGGMQFNDCYYYGDCYEPSFDYGGGMQFNDCYTYYGCGGYYSDTPVYQQPYQWNWNYDWGFEEETVVIDEYVWEWDYDWHFEDDDHEYCTYGTSNWGDHCYTPEKPRPTCDISASDYEIEKGDSTTLHWDSSNATEATLSGHGSVSVDGSKTVSPSQTTTYVLNVKNSFGKTATCETTVKVKKKHTPPTDHQPVCALSASDTSIEEGDSTTLHWTSEHATSATLTSFGDVPTGGNRTVSPRSDKTYTLTVRDDDGDEDTCSVTIRVEEDEDEDVSCELDASDTRVDEGDRITLEWDTEGDVTYASINQGIGRVDEDGGEERVTVDRDTTFRLTVRNDDGDEDTCSVSVRVDEEDVFSSVRFEGEPTNNPPVVYLSSIPYTGLDDVNPAVLSFWIMLIALAGAGTWFAYRQGLIPTFAFATSEPIEEGHADGHIDEGHATEVTPEASAFLFALEAGDTDAAVEALRDAAASGAGVEETLESAAAHAPGTLKETIEAALAGSRETGIRGAKDALGA